MNNTELVGIFGGLCRSFFGHLCVSCLHYALPF